MSPTLPHPQKADLCILVPIPPPPCPRARTVQCLPPCRRCRSQWQLQPQRRRQPPPSHRPPSHTHAQWNTQKRKTQRAQSSIADPRHHRPHTASVTATRAQRRQEPPFAPAPPLLPLSLLCENHWMDRPHQSCRPRRAHSILRPATTRRNRRRQRGSHSSLGRSNRSSWSPCSPRQPCTFDRSTYRRPITLVKAILDRDRCAVIKLLASIIWLALRNPSHRPPRVPPTLAAVAR